MSDKVLLTLRHSRKSFVTEYFSGSMLLILLSTAYFRGFSLPTWASYSILGLAFVGVGVAELERLFGDRYKITQQKLMIVKGVFNIKKTNVYYQPLGFIPDIHVKQNALQRFLGYGTVYVVLGGNKFEVRDIDDPNRILRMLEDLIDKNRHGMVQKPN